jgi:hypothetical protein
MDAIGAAMCHPCRHALDEAGLDRAAIEMDDPGDAAHVSQPAGMTALPNGL